MDHHLLADILIYNDLASLIVNSEKKLFYEYLLDMVRETGINSVNYFFSSNKIFNWKRLDYENLLIAPGPIGKYKKMGHDLVY